MKEGRFMIRNWKRSFCNIILNAAAPSVDKNDVIKGKF
jgi:hypothetical protein